MTRRNIAASAMVAGLVAATSGTHLSVGPGAALIVLGAILIPLALLLGWNA